MCTYKRYVVCDITKVLNCFFRAFRHSCRFLVISRSWSSYPSEFRRFSVTVHRVPVSSRSCDEHANRQVHELGATAYSLLPAPTSHRRLLKDWNCYNSKANTVNKVPYFDNHFHNPGYTPTKTQDSRNLTLSCSILGRSSVLARGWRWDMVLELKKLSSQMRRYPGTICH